jgi:hypothetical protein
VRSAIAAAALSVALIVAARAPRHRRSAAAFSGSFVDALNNAIPDVTMTLKTPRPARSTRFAAMLKGRFTLDALPDGDL